MAEANGNGRADVRPGAEAGEAFLRARAAAVQGGVKAQADFALLLFERGEQAEAMPWLFAAARQREPRACYLLGVALFNGDLARRDIALAGQLMQIAVDAQIPQAVAALERIARAERGSAPSGEAGLVSERAYVASRLSLATLDHAVPGHGDTMLGLIEELILPLLKERLEILLPAAFERAVQAAIRPVAA